MRYVGVGIVLWKTMEDEKKLSFVKSISKNIEFKSSESIKKFHEKYIHVFLANLYNKIS